MSDTDPALANKVQVFQEKSVSFRVVHSDGAWLSVNPYRNLHIAFYSERAPIPKSLVIGYDTKESRWVESVPERDVKVGWFRELEVDVVVDLNGAKSLAHSLASFIEILEQQTAEYNAQTKED